MPAKTLDPCVAQKNRDDAAIYQFCMESYDTAQDALSCVKEHIDI
jgi:hypothetical protein